MSQLLSIAVDKLFDLKAQIATLRKEEEELKDFLIDSGLSVIDSDTVHCTISNSTSVIVDWKTVASKAGASRQLIRAHTTEGEPRTTVRLFAKKGK